MKKILSLLCFFVLGMVGTVDATTIIDPTVGWKGYFAWYDLSSQIDNILEEGDEWHWDWEPPSAKWEIDVGTDSTMSVEVKDGPDDEKTKGDEFAFYVDGVVEKWDEGIACDPLGYFYAEKKDLFLSAGKHTFTFYTTKLADNNEGSGFGVVDFSKAAPVPEPATLFLLSFGLLGVVCVGKKRQYL